MAVRIDSYESQKHQEYVRTFLDGRFENSAFCLLAPNGQDWLSRGGRGPEMVLGYSSATDELHLVADRYRPKADIGAAIVPDFHSVRQALNVASADQRVLVILNGSQKQLTLLRDSFREVSNHSDIIGRFHFDFELGDDWKKTVKGTQGDSGIVVVRPGEFGMAGHVMQQLPLKAEATKIRAVLLSANAEFARTTEKKVYSSHVQKGDRLGIYFEGAVPYGEDRDGDGEIDHRAGRRRSLAQ